MSSDLSGLRMSRARGASERSGKSRRSATADWLGASPNTFAKMLSSGLKIGKDLRLANFHLPLSQIV
jgi:hypothetical protein